MDIGKKLFLQSCLSNLQAQLLVAQYSHCPPEWRDIGYTPDYNKFYFIVEGEGMLEIAGTTMYPKPGQLFLMPAGIKQSYSAINSNTFKKYWCHFTAQIGGINLFDLIKPPYGLNVPDRQKLESLFKTLISAYSSSSPSSSLHIKASLFEIIAYFIESIPEDKLSISGTTSVEKLTQVISYIENNFADDITVNRLALIACLQPNYFIRFFNKHLGCSPMHYVQNVRLQKAKALLTGTEMTAAEIAASTGFNDPSHFSRSIKSLTGYSPSEYRKLTKK